MRQRQAVIAGCLVAGAGLTLVVTVSPLVRLAYSNFGLHVAFDTAEGMVAGLLGYLAIGRFSQRRQLRDLLLGMAFVGFTVGNLMLSGVAAAAIEEFGVGTVVWASIVTRAVASGLLCAAALAPSRTLPRAEHGVVLRTGVVALVLLVLVLVAVVAELQVPEVLDPQLSPESASRPRVVGHPLVLSLQLVLLVLFTVAAVGFLRRDRREGEELLFWLGAGCILRAFARLNYFLFPSLYSEWVYTGDILRLASYGLFLVGAARELAAYQRTQAQVAVLEERRRLARELHDGLGQELAFLRSQLGGGTVDPVMVPHLADAADRALTESRRAVAALADSGVQELADVLRLSAEAVAGRAGGGVSVHVAPDAIVPLAAWDDVARIVREATSNAVRHGGARAIEVRVERLGTEVRVVVTDDGSGFVAPSTSPGFGLRSMSERATLVGGRFEVDSELGRGTSIVVTLPG